MAKVSSTGEHVGCAVTGRVLSTAGGVAVKMFTVRPERGVMRGGIWYSPDAATVAVDPDGRWSAVLAPTSAVGRYQVKIGRQEFEMVVPDAAEAAFDAIARLLEVARPVRR